MSFKNIIKIYICNNIRNIIKILKYSYGYATFLGYNIVKVSHDLKLLVTER